MKRWVKPDGAIYMVHTRAKDNSLRTDLVTFGQLVAELDRYARWCVGDKVELGPWDKYVKARWWSARRGDVIYRINDYLDEGRIDLVLPQVELASKVDGYLIRTA